MTIAPPLETRKRKIYYPTEDGKPVSETDKHGELARDTIGALKARYADRPDIYVSGNNFVFYEEGNPKKRISPDCYVVFGAEKRQRDSYMSWREGGRMPDVVFEFTSVKTRREDTDVKLPLYETVLRVPEYFLFDPTGDYLEPRLHGYRLANGRYQALPLEAGRMRSELLQLDLVTQGDMLRLFDPQRGVLLPTLLELTRQVEREGQRAETEAQRATAEAQARVEAEAEIARLRAELAALRGETQT